MATKKLSTMETTRAAILSQPYAPRSKYDAGSAACISDHPPAWWIAIGMPITTMPSSSSTNWTQSV